MDNAGTFRARFRFRVQKKLNIKNHKHRFNVGEQEVEISPLLPDMAISESDWLVMNARGFKSELEAKAFASKLRAASDISSVATRFGIDSGIDLRTSGLGKVLKERLHEQHGVVIRDNVHGIDAFFDDGNVRIAHFAATGSVLYSPEPFLSDLSSYMDVAANMPQKTKDVVLLLNYALMKSEPVAQIVFAFSAVEMLGQEDWSADQRALLDALATDAVSSSIGTPQERSEVSEAIKKSMQRLSLRQGVVRLLVSLDLGHLKKDWDSLYSERSTLVHGLAPRPGADYSQLAAKAVALCGRILLSVIGREVPLADRHIDRFYATT